MSDTLEKTEKKAGRLPYVGRPMERVEDEIMLKGLAQYADDYPERRGTLHGAILRSPHAHAEIVSIDASAALARPGVVAVITGEDVQKYTDPFLNAVKQPMKLWSLAVGRVRFVGEQLALVIAQDRYQAEDALEYIDVKYRLLPTAVDPLYAASAEAPLIHEEAPSNVMSERSFSYGDPEKAFAEADHKIDLTIDFPRSSHTPLEGYVVVAEYHPTTGVYDVFANFQGPFSVHPVMSRALRVTDTRLRLRTPAFSGGGFGIKIGVFPYIVLMGVAARIVGHPVKWVEDRYEHLAAATAAPNRIVRLEVAAKKDGRVTAFRFDQLDDYGAHVRAPMPGPLYRMHGVMTGAYDIPNLAIRNRLVMTNKCPSGMVRGFGGPQIYYAMERAMHRLAIELGLDPLDVIRKNLVRTGTFPFRTAAGALLDSGDYTGALDIASREGKLDALKQRRAEARAEGRLYGIGYAVVVEPTQSNMGYLSNILPHEERVKRGFQNGATSMSTVNVDPFGGVSVTSDTTPQGQGHATILSQIVADELGLTMEDIVCNLEIDTQKDPWSIAAGSYSCRFASGPAVATHLAARKMRDKLARIASTTLNVPVEEVEFADGRIFARGNPDNALSFNRTAGTAHWSPGLLPPGMEAGLSEQGIWSPPELTPPNEKDQINTSLTYGFNFDFCGVEIDRQSGEVRIDHYVTIHDAGRLLNPLIAEGQLHGSYAHGIGEALYEEFVYGEDGSFKSGTFADYLVPSACEVPEPMVLHMESPSPMTPLGAKGIAEGNCMSTPVCIANAVCDALGIEHVNLPLTPAKISALIEPDEPPPPSGAAAPVSAPVAKAGEHALIGTGETFVPAAPDLVWRTLLDPEKLAAVIPGCHKLDLVGENDYRAMVSLGVGPVRGRFEASVRLFDLDPPTAASLSGALVGPLGSSRGGGRVRLAAEGTGTRVTYEYGVEISGKVAAVGGRMIEGAARLVVGQFFDRLAAQMGGTPPPSVSWWRRLLRALGVGR
jgi:2-furoyl-CoA dehydrogenase large subunit